MRALIVDDSPAVRERLLASLLEGGDVEALEASDPDQALQWMASVTLDVVLVDLCLGAERGFELIGRLKALQPEVKVIVLTNDVGDAQRRECLARGADHFFDKSRQFEQALAVARKPRGHG